MALAEEAVVQERRTGLSCDIPLHLGRSRTWHWAADRVNRRAEPGRSFLLLAHLARDFVYLSLGDTSVPVPACQLSSPGTAPAAPVHRGSERQRFSGDSPSWVRPFWHSCMTVMSAWPGWHHQCCRSEMLLVAAWLLATARGCSVKVQTPAGVTGMAPAPFLPWIRMTSEQTEWSQKNKNRSAIQTPPAFLENPIAILFTYREAPRGLSIGTLRPCCPAS